MAVSRAGDWFGSPVNLASRCHRSGADRFDIGVGVGARGDRDDETAFTWSFAGARRLKGIKSDVKRNRARRTTAEGD